VSDISVKGLKQLDDYLSAFPKNMQKGAYRQGLTAAAKPIRDEARLLAPKRTGKMAKSIKTGSARQNQDGTFSVSIRLDGDHDFLGVFHEYGVSPHFIAAGDSDMSARLLTKAAKRGDVTGDVATGALKIGDKFISGGVMHPGHSAHPFMRPALDNKADEAVKAFAEKLRAYIENKTGFDAGAVDEAA
jgi:HK97 gp10 family phage protein